MAEDSVLARYETQAISIENEEKRKKEKEEMVEEMRRLQRKIEGEQFRVDREVTKFVRKNRSCDFFGSI